MKIIIHAGMHKTGSSSIQHNFAKCGDPKLHYANWRAPNHSGMFALLFGPIEGTLNYPTFRRRGLPIAEVEADRAMWRAALEKDLSSAEGKTFLLSAEVFSAPGNRARVREAAHFFKTHGEVRVIAYVRPPISFMQSAMQQRLKAGSKLSGLSKLYPTYRQRFEVLDDLFGRDNVELIKYDRSSLRNGDVVLDFGSRIGVAIPDDTLEQRNASLSLEAAGALYIQRNMGSGQTEGYRQATAVNRKLVNTIEKIGSTKIAFSAELVRPIIEEYKADIDWIEHRVGQPILDIPSDTPTVSSFDDLVNAGVGIIPELERRLGAPTRNTRTLEYIISLLEQLKERCEIAVQSGINKQ